MMIGLVLVGLVAGWVMRARLPRERLPLVVALAFLPALLHAFGTTWFAASLGLDLLPVVLFALFAAASIALAWWWMRGAYHDRPFLAPVAVPVQAFLQFAASSLLDRSARTIGAAVDVLPSVALTGLTIAIAAALFVLLPSRAHFPRLGITPPRWWTALGRATRRRR